MFNYDKQSRIFPCILLTLNHIIFLVQFRVNKHLLIFSKTTNFTRPTGSCKFIPNCTRNHVITSTNIFVTVLAKLVALFFQKCTCALSFLTRSLIDRCQILIDTCKNNVSNFVWKPLKSLLSFRK